MVLTYVCDACQNGDHENCEKGDSVPEGRFGGSLCTCCGTKDEDEDLDKEGTEDALNNLIDAWESLPGGRHYSKKDIQKWLMNQMKPAVDKARKSLGRDIPEK